VAEEDDLLAPDLIGRLGDKEGAVVQAARQGLKRLSGEDFGPESGGGAEARAKSVQRWRDW
jgi:hypothetical protein